MNNKITMPALVALLALKTGMTKERSEEFLKEFFRLIAETLQKGEAVRIGALGTFRVLSVKTRKGLDEAGEEVPIPGHNRIVFTPSPTLAEEINAPFSMFEAVEINPDAEDDLLHRKEEGDKTDREAETISSGETVTKEETLSKQENSESEEEAAPKEEKPEEEAATEGVPAEERGGGEPIADDSIAEESSSVVDERPEEEALIPYKEETVVAKKGRFKFLWGFICGLILAMLLAFGAYLFFIRGNMEGLETEEGEYSGLEVVASEESEIEEDSLVFPEPLDSISDRDSMKEAATPDTAPSDKMIKDVIGQHRYLTTMAQAHYGNFNLWPYIYEENKSFLGHPDRIKPGTEVMVPPLSKYGVNPTNPEDIRKAKRLGVEIYNRFK